MRRRVLELLGLGNPGHPLILCALRWHRRLLGIDRRIRDEYLHGAAAPKLHVGGGRHQLPGWLNTDLEPLPGVMRMDATQRFPFDDDTFQLVFTEHMIEHLSLAEGKLTLRECCRVLRKGGAIRVVTPDLAALTGLRRRVLSALEQRYLVWFCETFLPKGQAPTPEAVIHAHRTLWGHQHLYDEATLRAALEEAGFSSIRRFRLHESTRAEFRGLENIERYPEGLLDFESVALEAEK